MNERALSEAPMDLLIISLYNLKEIVLLCQYVADAGLEL